MGYLSVGLVVVTKISYVGCGVAGIMGHVVVAGNRTVANIISIVGVAWFEEIGFWLTELPCKATAGTPFLNILIATNEVLVVDKESCVGWRLVGCVLLFERGFEVGFGNDFP